MSSAVASVPRTIKQPPAASVSGPRSKAKPKATPANVQQQEQSLMPLDWDVSIDRIAVRHNDRTEFDKKAIETLAVSISERGLDNAITVRKSGEGFELIAGERRLRAARSLGWTTIRARIVEADDKSADLLRLEENLLREDLNQIERAAGIKRYIDLHGESQSAVGKRFGMTQAQVSNLLRLLLLTPFWQEAVKAGRVAHTIARDILCPWSHRPQLLDFVAEHSSDDDETFERDHLQSLIHMGIRSLTRSCRREQYYEFQSYNDTHCCFKLDDKNRHSLDVEDSPSGEPRSWNVAAWDALNEPALKSYKERQKKDKAKHQPEAEAASGKKTKAAKVEQTCNTNALRMALLKQLLEKLAAAINPKKHKASIVRVFAFMATEEDIGDAMFGDDRFKLKAAGRLQVMTSVPDADLPAWLCKVVAETLRADYVGLDCSTVCGLAAMLPIDLMHDWTPTEAVLESYSDSQLVAFAHDCEIDHTQSRLNLIFALTKPGVWQAGHVPEEVTAIIKGDG